MNSPFFLLFAYQEDTQVSSSSGAWMYDVHGYRSGYIGLHTHLCSTSQKHQTCFIENICFSISVILIFLKWEKSASLVLQFCLNMSVSGSVFLLVSQFEMQTYKKNHSNRCAFCSYLNSSIIITVVDLI